MAELTHHAELTPSYGATFSKLFVNLFPLLCVFIIHIDHYLSTKCLLGGTCPNDIIGYIP